MPQPRGAMANALREAIQTAPSMQRAAEQTAPEPEETIVAEQETAEEPIEEVAAEEAAPDSQDGQEIEFINDLPQALGWEPEQFYNLSMRLADDEDPVPLGEIKDRLQSVSKAQSELAQQRAELERQQQELQSRAMQFGQANQATTERMGKAQQTLAGIQAQYQRMAQDWDKRRELEPGKVALEQQEIGAQYAAAQQEYQVAAQEAAQQQTMARQQWMTQQHQILSQRMPDWNDADKRQAKQQELQRFAMERYGATAQELQAIDAKTILLLNDAMEGAKLREQAKTAVQSVRNRPKVVPKGARLKAAAVTSQDVAQRVTRAQKTRTRKDITSAVRGVLGESITRK